MKVTIDASVGRGGENRPEDVGKIQSLLNATGLNPPLEVNREAGAETIKAITEFQYRHTLEPDGRIDPDGPTLRTLNRAYKVGDMPVPDHSLVKLLGYGAFGEVWMAQTSSGVKKALKLIPLDRGSGWKEFKGVFRVRDIRNPCLVSITDVWLLDTEGKVLGREDVDQLIKDASSSLFGRGTIAIPITKPKVLVVAMQLCEKSLYNVLQESGGKGIPKDKLLRFMDDAARGLDYLNSRQHQFSYNGGKGRDSNEMVAIRHCDVKPENIMVVGGCAQVCDFGLAQIARAGGVRKRTGQLHASVYYAAPEMLDEEGVPTETTDQYSLALTYYHLRTGDLPFRQEDRHSLPSLLSAHTQGRLDLSKLPETERKVIRKATSLNPNKRYKTCGEMVRELKFGPPKPLYKDLRIVAPVAAMLLSIVVAGVVISKAPDDRQQRWSSAGSQWETVQTEWTTLQPTVVPLDEFLSEYGAIVKKCNDLWNAYGRLQSDSDYEAKAGQVRANVLSLKKEVLTKMLQEAAGRLETVHGSGDDVARPGEQMIRYGDVLDFLAKESGEFPEALQDVQLLRLRHEARRWTNDERRIGELRRRIDEVRKSTVEASRSTAFAEGTPRRLVLDVITFLANQPRPARIAAFAAGADTDLEAVFSLLPELSRLVAASQAVGSSHQWANSWEQWELRALDRSVFEYLKGYGHPWGLARLTPEREKYVRTIWGKGAAELLPASNFDLQIGDAVAYRRLRGDGNAAQALNALKRAETYVDEERDPAIARRRIAVEQLCVWLAFPDNDACRRSLITALAAPPADLIWEACAELRRTGELNPLVRGVWAECRSLGYEERAAGASDAAAEALPDPHAFVAEGMPEAEDKWYARFLHYAIALASRHQGEAVAAAEQMGVAYEKWTAGGDSPEALLLAAEHRRRMAAEVLISAAAKTIAAGGKPGHDGGKPLDAAGVRSLTDILQLSAESAAKAAAFLDRTKAIGSSSELAEYLLYRLIADYSQMRQGDADRSAWSALAPRAAALVENEEFHSDAALRDWAAVVHLVAADALRRQADGGASVSGDVLAQAAAHYGGAIGKDFSAEQLLESNDARILYEQVITPAVEIANALSGGASGNAAAEATGPLRESLAAIYRAQGLLINAGVGTIGNDGDSTVAALTAFQQANRLAPTARSLLEESHAMIRIGGSPEELARVVRTLAKRAVDLAMTPEEKFSAQYLNAYALMLEARISPDPESGKRFAEAKEAFRTAGQIIHGLRSQDPDKYTEDYARVLTGFSTAHVEYAVATRPGADEWYRLLGIAATSAEQATREFPKRREAEYAWIAWGNALEDMALYCDRPHDQRATLFAAAVDKFAQAEEACALFPGGLQHASAKISLARCRIRSVDMDALSSGAAKQDVLAQARKDLGDAIEWLDDLTNTASLRRQKAEAHYWLGLAIKLDADDAGHAPIVQQVEQHWQQAEAAVKDADVHHWATYQLERARYAWNRGDDQRTADLALEILRRLRENPAARAFLAPQQLRDAIAIAVARHPRPGDPDLVQLVDHACLGLDPLSRAEVYAQRCGFTLIQERETMLTQARSDLQNAEVAFGEIGDVAQGATTTDVELLRVAARLKSARGLMAYAETLAKFRRREAHTWDGAYAALKQAVEAWNALRSGPATESAASAGSDIARAIEGELSAEARNLLVGANLQVLRKAGSRANWNQLVNEIPKLLNVNLPDDRKYLDAWESNKANIPAPAN